MRRREIHKGDTVAGVVVEPEGREPEAVANTPELQRELDRRLAQKSVCRMVGDHDGKPWDGSDATASTDNTRAGGTVEWARSRPAP